MPYQGTPGGGSGLQGRRVRGPGLQGVVHLKMLYAKRPHEASGDRPKSPAGFLDRTGFYGQELTTLHYGITNLKKRVVFSGAIRTAFHSLFSMVLVACNGAQSSPKVFMP